MFQFFAIVIISTLCLLLDTLTRINFNKIELPKDRPEYNAQGVDGRVYDKAGKLLYNLVSEEAWEYPNDVRIFLKTFQINMYHENSDLVKYHITSDNGWINHITKVGELGNNTVVTIPNSNPNQTIRLYGRNISLDIDKGVFASNEDAKAIQGKSVVYSHGFTYDNKRKFLVLNSKVKVIYEK
jgi:lipopolysaccharide export system protein LptC